jgi:predicted RecB family nuclease
MKHKKFILTEHCFDLYYTQPAALWYELHGDHEQKDTISEFGLKLIEQAHQHEHNYIAQITDLTTVISYNKNQAAHETYTYMQQGKQRIYQSCIEEKIDTVLYRGSPFLLEKNRGNSQWGSWHYIPVLLSTALKLDQTNKHKLLFYALILERLQNYMPSHGIFINGNKQEIICSFEPFDIQYVRESIAQILLIRDGLKPEFTISSAAKRKSPWYKAAFTEARQKHDITMLYKLDSRSVSHLRSAGCNTLHDLINIDIHQLPKIPYAPLDRLKRLQLQARAVITDTVISVASHNPLPDAQIKIYFDIEGDPTHNVEYLFGFWITGDPEHKYAQAGHMRIYPNGKYFLYFIAEQPEHEEQMWHEFMLWLSCLPDHFIVYHYANYEKTRLKTLSSKYYANHDLIRFQEKLIDLLQILESAVIFPLSSYSIKEIAKSKFINYQWRHQQANGGLSILWFEQWLKTGNQNILTDIINYNEDDVRATEAVCEWLNTHLNQHIQI